MKLTPLILASAAWLTSGLLGCASGGLPAPVGEPVADAAAFADAMRNASIPTRPQQVNFGWTLDEQGSRVRGRGVVRVEAPERIRLDLFGPRGETYLIAALVDGHYRLPAAAAGTAPLPSPALLWSALGVLEPPSGGVLLSANVSDTSASLRYETAGGEVYAYTFHGAAEESLRLSRLERAGRQGVLETVGIDRNDAGEIVRARYRDWSNFRDLTLEIESVRESDSFPVSIWRPDVATP
jgi:hypothetical protein